MDQNDRAWRLAAAAEAAWKGDAGALDRAFVELQPTSEEVARAHSLCLTTAPFNSIEGTRLMLTTRLQVLLTQEHVAAQRRMRRSTNILIGVLIVLVVILVLLGGFEVWEDLYKPD
ncbi:MAG TPA: hypothetical protein VE819_10865 [Steroidobacteraceae bacterium]|nr:hypothetical protein [Steroidobacteraceae bacterium]